MAKTIYMAGLPRSGSTMLANLLAMHSDITSTPSSPLCHIIGGMKNTWSNDVFFKAQLNDNFDEIYPKTKRIINAVISEWHSNVTTPIIVDKNRGWVYQAELLREIQPDFKMIITLRDLRGIFSSIEKQHRKTLFINFADGLEPNIIDNRANNLFSNDGIIGSSLRGLYNLGDIYDMNKHILIWRYEDFLANPQATMDIVFDFIGVSKMDIDINNIKQSTIEDDSHYNMKYRHIIHSKISKPEEFPVSPRLLNQIVTSNNTKWFYEQYYPEILMNNSQNNSSNNVQHQMNNQNISMADYNVINNDFDENEIALLEKAIKEEAKI